MLRRRTAPIARSMYIGLCVRQSRADGPFPLSITIATVYFARIGWEGTNMGNSERFVTSTVEKAKAG